MTVMTGEKNLGLIFLSETKTLSAHSAQLWTALKEEPASLHLIEPNPKIKFQLCESLFS